MRSVLITGDEPVVLTPGSIAERIVGSLERLVVEARRNGRVLDADVAEWIQDMNRAAVYSKARRSDAGTSVVDGCSEVAGSPGDRITVDEAAELLECSARNVTALAVRGSLTGELKAGRWWIDRESVIRRKRGKP